MASVGPRWSLLAVPFACHIGQAALLHSVRSWRAEAAADIQNQITMASSWNATVRRRFAGSSTASS